MKAHAAVFHVKHFPATTILVRLFTLRCESGAVRKEMGKAEVEVEVRKPKEEEGRRGG